MHSVESDSCILIITRENDTTADHVLRRMADRGIPYFRLNAEKFGDVGIALRFPNIHDSVISFGGMQITISKIRGVWLRRLIKPTACQIPDLEARTFAEGELDFSLRWLIDLLGNYCPVLDPEANILKGRNKFDQLVVAENVDLRIPITLITNDSTAARDFVGSRVFACRIDSQSTPQTRVDWRHYDDLTPHSIYATDKSLDDRLTAIMRHYGIRFASFDLIVTLDGKIVFLEMNPSTQFLWIEKLTGMPITDAIILRLWFAVNFMWPIAMLWCAAGFKMRTSTNPNYFI